MTANRAAGSPAEFVELTWTRVDQPQWIKMRSKVTPLLLVGWEGEHYKPLDEAPALFLKFANLEDTEAAYADFARSYGVPGGARWAVSTGEKADNGEDLCYPITYDFNWWRKDRMNLAFAVELWDALRARKAQDMLGKRVMTTSNAAGSDDVSLLFDDGKYYPCCTVRRDSSPEAKVRAVLGAICSASGLHDGAYVALAAVPSPRPTDAVGLRLTFEARSLLGAMWLQLALAIDGNRSYERCPECGNWWDATGARSDKKTCSDKCRQARKRHLVPTSGGV